MCCDFLLRTIKRAPQHGIQTEALDCWRSIVEDVPVLPRWRAPEPLPLPPKPEIPKTESFFDNTELYKAQWTEYTSQIIERKERCADTSRSIVRCYQYLITLATFCLITVISSPDIFLLTANSAIEIPGLGYKLDFLAFIIVAPLLVTGLLGYIHLLMDYRDKVRVDDEPNHETVLDTDGRLLSFLKNFILYWSVPIVWFSVTWKVWLIEGVSWALLFVTVSVMFGCLALQVRRTALRHRPALVLVNTGLVFALFAAALFLLGARGGLDLPYANLSEQNLAGINLSGADLVRADFTDSNLANARFGSANLENANFSGANLVNAFFSDPRSNDAETNLRGAVFRNADLIGANFFNTRLDEANFTGAELAKTNFNRAKLSGVDLSGTDLTTVYVIEPEQVAAACGTDVILPEGYSIQPCRPAPRPLR